MVGPPLNKCDDDDVIWGVDSRGGTKESLLDGGRSAVLFSVTT